MAARFLPELNKAIGHMYGTEAECIEGTALFSLVAPRFGIIVRPRAVSVFIHSDALNATALTGAKGLLEAKSRGLVPSEFTVDDLPGERPWVEAGHMIVVADGPPALVFDPTFRQFSNKMLPDVVHFGPVSEGGLTDQWRMQLPGTDVEIIYFPADEVPGWREDIEAVKPQLRADSDSLFNWFNRGGTGDGVKELVTPRRWYPNE